VKKNNNLYDDNLYDIISEIEEKQIVEEQIEDKPMTLILDNNIIQCRKSDGYINATQLCKAGNKHFNDWFRLKSTNEYLVSMETKTGIPVLNLINKNIGGDHIGTWIHPKVAINLAQWLSPEFAVQVSNWIYDLMTKGKVEANIKLLKDKDNEIANCKKRIEYLQKQSLKRHSRKNLDNNHNVVYIITCDELEANRKYIIGKAKDLLNRLSQYNKMSNYKVIYLKPFKNEMDMNLAESIVLRKLDEYKEQMNRDRFILPKGKDIKLFTNPFDDAYNFFNN